MDQIITSFQDTLYTAGPKVLVFLIRLLLCYFICKLAKRLIRRITDYYRKVTSLAPISAGTVTFTTSFIRIGSWTVVIVFLALWLGIKQSSLLALFASISVALSLSLQGLLGNLAGGLMLLIFTPFNVGDFILVSDIEGTVEKIEILYTTICTIDNRLALIPNGDLIAQRVINATGKEIRMIHLRLNISYDADIRKVKDVLTKILLEDPWLVKDQPQYKNIIAVDDLADSSVIFTVRCWVATSDYPHVRWALLEKIKMTFDEEGISFPYPQLDVHMSSKSS